jgi:hypothetical protein
MGNNTWGQLGNLFFEFWKSPRTGSYYETKSSNFQQLEIHNSKNKKQPSGHDLTTISFAITIPDLPYLIYETTPGERALRATGISALGLKTTIGKEKRYGRLEGDPKGFEAELEEMMESQDYYNFFINEDFKGLYTINRLEKNIDFKPDGSMKVATFNITLEEWVE